MTDRTGSHRRGAPRPRPPGTTGSTPPVGTALEAALDAIHRVRSRPEARRAVVGPAGERLTATDRWLLARLDEAGALRMSALARWQDVDRSTMTAQVRRLEQQGWARREPDPADGRAVLVVLDDAGRAVIRHVRQAGRDATDRLVAHWPQDDQEALARLLVRLTGELDQLAGRAADDQPPEGSSTSASSITPCR